MYKKVDTKLDFVKNENEVLEFWNIPPCLALYKKSFHRLKARKHILHSTSGTSLSKAELENGDNYKVLKENSIFVEFKSLEEENTYFLVWTTTVLSVKSSHMLLYSQTEALHFSINLSMPYFSCLDDYSVDTAKQYRTMYESA